MERTAEVRWFWPEPAPPPIAAWFGRAAGPPQTRRDTYLVLAGTDALGVKTRGGSASLELKVRPRPGEPLGLPGGGRGQLEEWQKWSLSRAGVTRFLPRLGLPRGRWIPVVKQRRRATIPYEGNTGCTVELTALRAGGESWTTLGFEASGSPADLVPALHRAVESFFASVDLPEAFDGVASCGYPAWLATL